MHFGASCNTFTSFRENQSDPSEAAWKAVRPTCFVNNRQVVKNKVHLKYWPMQYTVVLFSVAYARGLNRRAAKQFVA